MYFSLEQKKELTREFKIMAIVEKLKAEAIAKEMQDNKDNYTDKELEILNNLLHKANEEHIKCQETYIKGSVLFGAEELSQI